MSTVTEVENTGQQAHFQTDISKIFIWNPRTILADYENTTGSDVVLKAGRLMGRISATGFLLELVSGAVDDSNIPLGFLIRDITIPTATTPTLTIVVSGDVAEELVILDAGDTLETVISGRRLRDRILADTQGILLVPSTDLTNFDNS